MKKTKDPEKMKDWYNRNPGLVTNEYGSVFEFRSSYEPEKKAYSAWNPLNTVNLFTYSVRRTTK
jgi:hypothetical protein